MATYENRNIGKRPLGGQSILVPPSCQSDWASNVVAYWNCRQSIAHGRIFRSDIDAQRATGLFRSFRGLDDQIAVMGNALNSVCNRSGVVANGEVISSP
jgi:hypothetical protein